MFSNNYFVAKAQFDALAAYARSNRSPGLDYDHDDDEQPLDKPAYGIWIDENGVGRSQRWAQIEILVRFSRTDKIRVKIYNGIWDDRINWTNIRISIKRTEKVGNTKIRRQFEKKISLLQTLKEIMKPVVDHLRTRKALRTEIVRRHDRRYFYHPYFTSDPLFKRFIVDTYKLINNSK